MAIYVHTAVDAKRVSRQGELQARDRTNALEMLARDGLTVFSLREKGNVERRTLSLTPFSRITRLDRILLTRHLSSIVHAGVSLGEAIDILISTYRNRPLLSKILAEAKRSLEEGHPLSSVFAAYPEHFPPVFVGFVKAGEVSGTLQESLESLGAQLLRDYELVRKVRAAMVYPAILLAASLGIILLLLTFVLPRLANSFGQANIDLPLMTRLIVGTSSILAAHKAATLALAFFVTGFLVWFLRKPSGKHFLHVALSHMPVGKKLIQELALARFSRTLKNLIKSGVPLIEALDIVAASVGNEAYRRELASIEEELRKGVSFADTFRKRELLFPKFVESLVTIGERTGSLDRSLDTIADFYEEEADRTLKTLVTLLEPLLLLVMGLIVGGIALSVLLPIYQLIGQFR